MNTEPLTVSEIVCSSPVVFDVDCGTVSSSHGKLNIICVVTDSKIVSVRVFL